MEYSDNSADYQDLLKSVLAKFIASLVDRSQTLTQELRSIERNEWNNVDYRAVYIIAHQLAGTSASLGYRELGKIAEKAEAVWSKILPSDNAVDGPSGKADLQRTLRALCDALDQILATAETK